MKKIPTVFERDWDGDRPRVTEQVHEGFDLADRSYDGIRVFLADKDVEGIVFHHPDGRMAKIKKRDFGFKR